MWWLILSGALHNFNMYALGSFLSPFLIRFHGVDLAQAGLIALSVFGLSGVPGLLCGGVAGDAITRRRANGRLLLGAWLLLASVPLVFLALGRPRGDIAGFIPLMGLACALMHKPALLVLDEPANALDPVQVAALRTLIREQSAAGTAVILSTHLLAEVTAVCDRVAILHDGCLRHDGPVQADDHQALERTFFEIAMHGDAAARAA